jgi:hypothetical protein
MKILPKAQERIKSYEKSLEALETAFACAGIDLEFVANVTEYDCLFIGPKGKDISQRLIVIEGDSPIQALKDVVAGVRLL